jgi:EAL domain-containing protein (putative c-di-GMP-specific phosphodiesterase class I)
VKSHEILVRLRDEHGELIMPSGFLPTAERFGLAAEIDQWVIRHAITLLAEQRRQDPARRFAINLSAQSLNSPAVAEVITQTLAATGLEPTALTFEVTETAAIADMNTAVAFLAQLRALGCQTALDDFGSGLSSFAYLKEMPVDLVKIDGRFVKHLLRSPVDQAMVKAMNDIAHALGKETVAEFVESEEHFQLLKELGVDYGQGYHLGKPEIVERDPASARSRRARA